MTKLIVKACISIILVFVCVSLGMGQTRYINSKYGFSVLPPTNTVIDDSTNKELGYVSTYSCDKPACSSYGLFTVMKIQPLPDTTQAEAVSLFQKEWVLANNAKEFLSGADPALNTTILSSKYVAINGRPANRIDYNFIANGINFTGSVIAVFLVEKQIVIGFNYLSVTKDFEEWNKSCESSIKSLLVYPVATPPLPLPKTGNSSNSGSSDDWESKVTSEWERKEGWKYFAYTGGVTDEVLFFLNQKQLNRSGDIVRVWVKEVPKNTSLYIARQMRAATPAQRAAMPKIPLNYFHQLYSIDCGKMEYKTVQAILYWSDGSTNTVAINKDLITNVSPGSVGEKMVGVVCNKQ